MTIGAVIPTRDDRPLFLSRCKEYIERQTREIDHVLFVDYPQKTFPVDITERYAHGLEVLKDKCDIVFLMENDDYYSSIYVETMIRKWEESGTPQIFGIGKTTFYHIINQYYWSRTHEERACAYCSMIRTDAIDKIDYRKINSLLFDMGIWKQKHLEKKTCQIDEHIVIGMKHGRGHCGASGHNAWFYEKTNKSEPSTKDTDYQWLRQQIGEDDTKWYIDFAKQQGA